MGMNGATNTGLLELTLSEWVKQHQREKHGIEFDNAGDVVNKLGNLNTRFKSAAKGVTDRANKAEEENFMLTFFSAWANESRLSGVVKHYGGKMDAKKAQLDAVQGMFKQFAAQLEKGM